MINGDTSISPKDKKFLDSYDISIFKSAVAYIQNSRHTSCNPVVHDSKSPLLKQHKNLKEIKPPLLPIESRLASYYQKFSHEYHGVKKPYKIEAKVKNSEIEEYEVNNFPHKDIKQHEQLIKNNEAELGRSRYSRKMRRSSHGMQIKDEEKASNMILITQIRDSNKVPIKNYRNKGYGGVRDNRDFETPEVS
ncbi:hypothetical protein SteCoe_7550 [Stentor coeruleus]|uniref:Uncharacterized protein n=1 Tax=Stentor coeruleus TaxID=5963 RepID=A0A1R2CMG7_9CILI|nr:hypothetical protein SteCoe_7550 [Stentor coeruleus]